MRFTLDQIRAYLVKQDSFGDAVYNLSEENILEANLPELYTCSSCGVESEEYLDFETDLDNNIDLDELTCEGCYGDIDQ